jgi:hypothetical protein
VGNTGNSCLVSSHTAKSKILSKKKMIFSSKTWLEIRYQVNLFLPSKRVYLIKTSIHVVAKKRCGNFLLAKKKIYLKQA